MSFQALNGGFEAYVQKVDAIVSDQLMKSGETILESSKALAPIDTGLMVNTADVSMINPNRVEVRYNTDYSLYVHEDMSMNHPNGGQAKFLEQATVEYSSNHLNELANRLKGA
jgi:nitrous oxidase accessory protein NosD